jgi:predicted phage terminase large subunit-like protein
LDREELIKLAQASLALESKLSKNSFYRFCCQMLPVIEGHAAKAGEPPPQPAPHHHLIIDQLERIETGEIKRLMFFLPPGSAKSTYASVLFPPYFLGRNQNRKVISTSHDTDLAEGFGRRIRKMVDTEDYHRIFDLELDPGSKAAGHWSLQKIRESENVSRETILNEYWAIGILSSVTGRRCDLLIIDDPVRGRKDADSQTIRDATWEAYKSDFRTRLKPGCPIIYIGTRWHEDDPAGRILPENYAGESGSIQGRDGELWEVVCLPAIAESPTDPLGRSKGDRLWPEWYCRENKNWFEQEKRTQGPRNWAALFQQRPAPEEGDFFQREWFRYYEVIPKDLTYYGASDYGVSAKDDGDPTIHGICGVDADDNFYIVDWYRGWVDSERWIQEFIYLVKIWKPLMWGEEKGQILKSLDPFIRKKCNEEKTHVYRKGYPSSQDKVTRAQAIRARMSEGKVFFPANAPWLEALISECLMFPSGKYDDQVDVLSLFGRMMMDMTPMNVPNQNPEDIEFDWVDTGTGIRSNKTFNQLRDLNTNARLAEESWDD